jgi:hypothetical protein
MTARLTRRLWLWIGLGALVLLLGTCTLAVIIPGVQLAIRESQAPPPQALAGLPTHSSAPSAAPSSRTTKATATPKATPILTTTATPAAPIVSSVLLTGFGATEAEWRASHVAATGPRLQSGCCWDPDPTLPGDLSTAVSGYRYTEVQRMSGRVLQYVHNFHRSTNQAQALDEVFRLDFPADARRVWSKRLDACALHQVQSATVDQALGSQGGALIRFVTSTTGSYDPANVGWASITVGNYSAKDGLGC